MENESLFKPNPKLKLMDQVGEVLRYYHYSYRIEQSYCKWILRYIRFIEGKKRSEDTRSLGIRRHHVMPSGSDCKKRLNGRLTRHEFTNRPGAIRCDIPLPPTYWKMGTISGFYKN